MIKQSTHYKVVKTTRDIICDCCNLSCKNADGIFNYMSLEANWNFGSKHDNEKWIAHLCENCVSNQLPKINYQKFYTGVVVKP